MTDLEEKALQILSREENWPYENRLIIAEKDTGVAESAGAIKKYLSSIGMEEVKKSPKNDEKYRYRSGLSGGKFEISFEFTKKGADSVKQSARSEIGEQGRETTKDHIGTRFEDSSIADNMTALIIDDDADLRNITARLLKTLGFEKIVQAKSHEKIEKALKKEGVSKVDFVLTDKEIKGQTYNGVDWVREIENGTITIEAIPANTPKLIHSTSVMIIDSHDNLAAAIKKPATRTEILEGIKKAFKNQGKDITTNQPLTPGTTARDADDLGNDPASPQR